MFLLVVLAILFLICAIQFKRGNWLKLVAGNTFSDSDMATQMRSAKSTANFLFIISGFFLFFYVMDYFDIKVRFIFILFVASILIYSLVKIIKYIKHYIKFGN